MVSKHYYLYLFAKWAQVHMDLFLSYIDVVLAILSFPETFDWELVVFHIGLIMLLAMYAWCFFAKSLREL